MDSVSILNNREVKENVPIDLPKFQLSQHREQVHKAFLVSSLQPAGAGGFGQVFKAYGVKDPKGKDESANRGVVAVKAVQLPKLDPKTVKKWKSMVLDELKFLQKLDHEHIVKFYQFDWLRCPTTGQKFCALFKTEFLEHNAQNVFDVEVVSFPNMARFALQIGAALNHMHDLQITHNDVKAANCMIAEYVPLVPRVLQERLGSVTYKLIDFGLAKQFDTDRFHTAVVKFVGGTLKYACPEKKASYPKNAKKPYNPYKADSFDFGLVLFMMLAGSDYVMGFLQNKSALAAWNQYVIILSRCLPAHYKKYQKYIKIIRMLLSDEADRLHMHEAVQMFQEAYNELQNVA